MTYFLRVILDDADLCDGCVMFHPTDADHAVCLAGAGALDIEDGGVIRDPKCPLEMAEQNEKGKWELPMFRRSGRQ